MAGRTSRTPYRHYKAEPAICENHGNLGTYAEREWESKAEAGSAGLAAAIMLTVGCETAPERRSLSFEEQIRLVETGRARVVRKVAVPVRGYEGGCGSAAAMV